MRILSTLATTFVLAGLVLGAACGGDDDSASSPTSSATDTASTAPTPLPSGLLLVSPSRELPPADHAGLAVFDVLTYFEMKLHGGMLTAVPCTSFDSDLGIIDCVEQGYGTIAVDPIPDATGEVLCRALLDPDGAFFAAGCSGDLSQGPGAFIYDIQS